MSARATVATAGFVIAAILGTACAQKADGATERGLPQVHGDGYPKRIVYPDGAEVRLDAFPRRILPANASALDFVVDLVDPARLAGVLRPALAYSALAANPPEYAEVPRVAEFASEAILAVDPDLVLAHAWQNQATFEVLTRSGVALILLPDCDDWTKLTDTLLFLGRALGVEERGVELVAGLEARRATLAAGEREGIRVLSYGNYGSGGATAGSGTTWDLMIGLAGMRNAAAEAGITGNVPIDFERILEIDPDVFLVGALDATRDVSTTADVLRNESALRGLDALREGRIAILPSQLYGTASHHVLTAAEELAAQVDAMGLGSGGR